MSVHEAAVTWALVASGLVVVLGVALVLAWLELLDERRELTRLRRQFDEARAVERAERGAGVRMVVERDAWKARALATEKALRAEQTQTWMAL